MNSGHDSRKPHLSFALLWQCYAAGMTALTHWDENVLPKLQDKGMMPMTSERRAKLMREAAVEEPWVTPLTADRTLPLPTLQQLYDKAHRVGATNGVAQFIRAHLSTDMPVQPGVLMDLAQPALAKQLVPILSRPLDDSGSGTIVTDELGICRPSTEFSEYYGEKVWICKRPADPAAWNRYQ